MRYAICNETYQGWTLKDVCHDVAAAGYDAIEIAPFTLAQPVHRIDQAIAAQARQTAQEAGLDVVGLHWLLSGTTGLHLTSPDPAVRQATTDFATQLVRCCAAMGGQIMVWGSPKQRTFGPEQSPEHAMDCAAEVLQNVCRVAGEFGITIALEPLARHETNFLNTAEQAVELINRVNHPACRLHLDVKAMSDEPQPIPQIIHTHAEHVAHVHVNDPNLRGPGMGEVDFEPILQTLHAVHYQGYLSVEVFDYEPDGPTIARQSLQYLRQLDEARTL